VPCGQAGEAARSAEVVEAQDAAQQQVAAELVEPAQPAVQLIEDPAQQPAPARSIPDDQHPRAGAAQLGAAAAPQAEKADGTTAEAGASAEQADPFGLESLIEPPPAPVPPAPREEQPPEQDHAAGEAAAAAREGVWVGQAR